MIQRSYHHGHYLPFHQSFVLVCLFFMPPLLTLTLLTLPVITTVPSVSATATATATATAPIRRKRGDQKVIYSFLQQEAEQEEGLRPVVWKSIGFEGDNNNNNNNNNNESIVDEECLSIGKKKKEKRKRSKQASR
jgi:hypothetical protein